MGMSLKPSPSDNAVQETFILKLEPKLEQQPVCGQRGSLVKQLRLRHSQRGFLCGVLCPALAAGPDDPFMFVIICRERGQLPLCSPGPSGPGLGDPQVGSWGLGAFQHQLLTLNGWS